MTLGPATGESLSVSLSFVVVELEPTVVGGVVVPIVVDEPATVCVTGTSVVVDMEDGSVVADDCVGVGGGVGSGDGGGDGAGEGCGVGCGVG